MRGFSKPLKRNKRKSRKTGNYLALGGDDDEDDEDDDENDINETPSILNKENHQSTTPAISTATILTTATPRVGIDGRNK